jgi:carboxypeptidase Taq
MGITKETSSIDTSPHPFTARMGINDVRITNRYIDSIESFFVAVHEAGHALYELGLPKKYANTVIYNAASIGLHESQSKFWEYMIGRNELFWKGYFNRYKKFLGKNMNWQNFYKNINQVKSSLVRVDADEVTYCLHIILRFEIERDLINGVIGTRNVKDIWNKKMKDMFGLTIKNDNDGIMQDMHWSMGAFGYFPTYAIGTIYSSQLYKQLIKDIPKAKSMIRRQDFKQIVKLLRNNIHHKGKTMKAEQIIKRTCGEGLNPEALIDYLNSKYSKIYGF